MRCPRYNDGPGRPYAPIRMQTNPSNASISNRTHITQTQQILSRQMRSELDRKNQVHSHKHTNDINCEYKLDDVKMSRYGWPTTRRPHKRSLNGFHSRPLHAPAHRTTTDGWVNIAQWQLINNRAETIRQLVPPLPTASATQSVALTALRWVICWSLLRFG